MSYEPKSPFLQSSGVIQIRSLILYVDSCGSTKRVDALLYPTELIHDISRVKRGQESGICFISEAWCDDDDW